MGPGTEAFAKAVEVVGWHFQIEGKVEIVNRCTRSQKLGGHLEWAISGSVSVLRLRHFVGPPSLSRKSEVEDGRLATS
jgi:hypothetical protein